VIFCVRAESNELESLKTIIRQQQIDAQKPIILPPPAVQSAHVAQPATLAAPPPPPPTQTSLSMEDQMKSLMKSIIPAPQRIPAPPMIQVPSAVGPGGCCQPPSPEDK
jgi:hypothetical protein